MGDGENKDSAYTKYKGAVRRRVTRIHLSPPKTVGDGENEDGVYTKYKGAERRRVTWEHLSPPLIRYGDLEKVGCMAIYLNKELLRYIGRQTAEGTMTTK